MILSAGLSPAWQQILRFDEFHLGEVNRAQEAVWCASGKVINVAVAATTLGEDASLISAIGGISGDIIQRELELLKVHADWIETSEATRVCTTILTPEGPTTELVENTADVDEAVLEDFIDRTRVYANVANVTVLTGSLPGNAPANLFSRILLNTAGRFLLDIRGESLLNCLPMTPMLVKPNREELELTLEKKLATEDDLLAGMRLLNDRGAQWVVVSDGPGQVLVHGDEGTFRFTPPKVNVVNPIGCGDALAAGIARELSHHDDVPEAVRFGIAAAAHNAENLLPARLNLDRCEELSEQVTMEEFT